MSTPSDVRTLVLHGVRLKGFADAVAVAEAVSLEEGAVARVLEELVHAGCCARREERRSGYLLTPAGRAEHARLLAEELDRAGLRDQLLAAYQRFVVLNPQLLEVCTAWQLRDVDGTSTVNDHRDPRYDAGVIARLRDLHDQALPVCEDLAGLLARFAHYGPRLTRALERVEAGQREWFTKPMIPSYHTVWFELHEDLLATLGIDRGAEPAAQAAGASASSPGGAGSGAQPQGGAEPAPEPAAQARAGRA